MGFRSVASLNGIVSLAYGVAGFVAPAALASVYGMEITGREELVLRLLSASYFAFGILCWAARGVTDNGTRRAIALSGFAGYLGQVPIDWWLVAGFAGSAGVGILIGGRLAPLVSQRRLKQAFALMLLVVGAYVLYRR